MILLSRNDIEQRYRKITEAVYQKRFKTALDEFSQWIRFSNTSDFYYQLETIRDNYKTLLRYAFEGYKDPKQPVILNSLSASLLSLADELLQHMREPLMPFHYSERAALLKYFGEDPLVAASWIEEIFFRPQKKSMISDTDGDNETEAFTPEVHDRIFKLIWLTGRIREYHISLARKINTSRDIEWYDKSMFVCALTLSLMNYFDPWKFILLTEFAESGEKQVSERALVGLLLGLIKYDSRVPVYPEIREKLKSLQEDQEIRNEIELILMQFLMARETEKITKEFEEEVLPEMKKMMPKVEDKLQLSDQTEETDLEGKNPGWKGLVDEVPGLYEKIEKFSKMQMEGGDVFMSTFQMLKRFDFFNRMSNWFMPFHRKNPEIGALIPEHEDLNRRLFDSLENAFYICNSDKYSFVLNFQAIPAQQRNLIVTNFEAELAQMKDMVSEEQMLDQSLATNAVIIQYIQDLYRFYKLFPCRGEFDDIFRKKISFDELYFYRTFFEKESFNLKLAEFYFDNGHYYEAIDLYEFILKQGNPKGELYEKIAFCYQKLGRFKKAIEYYKKAELFDSDHLWILKKLGWCCIRLKEYREALTYFEEALEIQPDEQGVLTQIGQCHLNLEDHENALQVYTRLLFFSPGNLKFLRPVAYCQFVTGKLEQSRETYLEILALPGNPSVYDLMNTGHVFLCLEQRTEALQFYIRSFNTHELSETEFLEVFGQDIPYLVAAGIGKDEIPLIKDHIIFQADKT